MADTPEKIATRWIQEINLAESDCEQWWRSGDVVIRRYKNADRNGKGGANAALSPQRRYAILWSNVQTLGPAIYAKKPIPVVSRRFKDEDPVGKVASEVLERCLLYTLDAYDFDERMFEVRQDYLLPGRGQVWVRYVPHMRQVNAEADPELGEGQADEDGQNEGPGPDETVTHEAGEPPEVNEEVEYEEVLCDHVAWKEFLTNPCREWADVRWVSRRVYMTRQELIERFGEKIGKEVPLDSANKGDDKESDDPDSKFKKACVYEIWDKPSRKAYWINKGLTGKPLDVRDDPLKLSGFFPCPSPLNATTAQDSSLPIPDYVFYQDQAEELDELTSRIGKLQDALRMVGFYAGEMKTQLQRVFSPGNENKLIPIDTYDAFKESGGVKGLIEWVPVDMVMMTLKGCYEARQQVISDIYQITGISDIIRGESDPNSTATAERLKGQWGSLRVRDRQKDVQKFARDVIRIKGEIIAEHYSIETMRAISGVKLLTAQEKQELQQVMALAQQAEQMGVPVPPELVDQSKVELIEQPTWDEVKALLTDDKLRSFRIDIETDSTIEPDENAAKMAFVEFVGAFSQLMTVASTIVPAAPYTAPVFKEMAKQSTRVFDVSREMEDAIDKAFDTAEQQPPVQPAGPPAPPPPSPLDEAKAQAEMGKLQIEQQRTQVEGMIAQTDAQIAMADLQLKSRDLDLKEYALSRDPTPQGQA